MQPKPPKPKPCKVCKNPFVKKRPFEVWCSPECGLELVKAKQAKEGKAKAKAERQADKAKRERLKTRSDYMKEAQREFNRYIRTRDADKPCICCGQPLRLGSGGSIGGEFDCGHYRSVGSAPHLRFHESNAHGQRKVCNRYGAGRAVDYRIGLVQRIGLDAVEALEADQTPRRYTIPDLIAIRDEYRAKTRALDLVETVGERWKQQT